MNVLGFIFFVVLGASSLFVKETGVSLLVLTYRNIIALLMLVGGFIGVVVFFIRIIEQIFEQMPHPA